ncbi:hypothetical protein ACA910_012750 [Epithemia clementina (nom. ined.)]
MLEEALKNDKKNPAEVAQAMLSYVQLELTAGGTAAESRFFRLYQPLCDRIFGPLVLVQESKVLEDGNHRPQRQRYRHKDPGWLLERSPWSLSLSSYNQGGSVSNSSLPPRSGGVSNAKVESDPVVKLLGTAGKPVTLDPQAPTLIEAISAESVNRPGWGFPFPFDALPDATRKSWLATLEDSPATSATRQEFVLTDNTKTLLTQLIRRGPLEQHDLVKFCRQKSNNAQQVSMMKLSPRGFHSPMGTQSTVTQSPAQKVHDESKKDDSNSPNVVLGMLEHFLFLFLNFPLAKPTPKPLPAPQGFASSSSSIQYPKQTYGDIVYNFLFRRYLRHFLPYEKDGSRHIAFSPENRESELFLRIMICLWMETHGRLKATNAVVGAIIDRHQRSYQLEPPSFDLGAAYDLVVVRYEPPSAQVQKCLCSVIIHIVLDPALNKHAVQENGWRPTAAMTAMTQPFYNYVRSSFRHASIHQQDSSPFFGVLDAWLIWLEPWNVNEVKGRDFSPRHAAQRMMSNAANHLKAQKRSLFVPKQGHAPSRYSPEWEPYIAANIHIYATPLAIFLRRARELDFSSNKHMMSMKIIERVFRVFTPQVVDAVSRHLSGISPYSNLVQRHCDLLGPYAPPERTQRLSSCQADMKGLLEEMYLQHVKKMREMDIFERIEAYIEGLFSSGVISGEERVLSKVVERAKAIVQLPVTYSPIAPPPTAAPQPTEDPKIIENGYLTEEGYRLVVSGAIKMDPSMVGYVGDKRLARPASYENHALVELAAIIYDFIFENTGFRVNLRFLADYGNLFLLLVAVFVWRMLW